MLVFIRITRMSFGNSCPLYGSSHIFFVFAQIIYYQLSLKHDALAVFLKLEKLGRVLIMG